MSEAASIVSQFVVDARKKVVARDVAVAALVQGLKSEESSGGGNGGGGPLSVPEHSRGVICMAGEGPLGYIVVFYDGGVVKITPCEF